MRRRGHFPSASWLWVLVGVAYFLVPLIGTLIFALQRNAAA